MNGNRYITIECDKKFDEIDKIGLLLEKYVAGTSYDVESKTWNVPGELCDEIKGNSKLLRHNNT